MGSRMTVTPDDRELLREFWRGVRADPAKLRRLLLIVVGMVGALVCATVLMVLIFAGIG